MLHYLCLLLLTSQLYYCFMHGNPTFWPILIMHSEHKRHQICLRKKPLETTNDVSHSWRWLSHFVGVGFNRQPLGREEKRDLADASHQWRQCDVLKKMQRRSMAERWGHACISWLASAVSFMLHNRSLVHQAQPADKLYTHNHADGRQRRENWTRPTVLPLTHSTNC